MDVSSLLQHFQYAIPVGIVLVCAVLVFVFGFKNAEQPPFAHLSVALDVDRKPASKKRSKIKEKKSATANQTITSEKASPLKKTSPVKTETKKSVKSDDIDGKLKERKQEENTPVVAKKEKNQVNAKSGKENKVEQAKNKKNLKNQILEKPVDFDEGDWEQAYSKKDKRKKKEDETPKKTKKSKKSELINNTKDKDQDKSEIKDKVAKETENKELKEKNQKDVILEPVKTEIIEEISEKVSEKKAEVKKVEKPEKKEKKEKEEKQSAKAKKAKKLNDVENVVIPAVAPIAEKSPVKVVEKEVEEAKVKTETVEPPKAAQIAEKNVAVFDELGDVWTEAKPQKKSKKKARKDN